MKPADCTHPHDKAKHAPRLHRWFCGLCGVCISYIEPVRQFRPAASTLPRLEDGPPVARMREREFES